MVTYTPGLIKFGAVRQLYNNDYSAKRSYEQKDLDMPQIIIWHANPTDSLRCSIRWVVLCIEYFVPVGPFTFVYRRFVSIYRYYNGAMLMIHYSPPESVIAVVPSVEVVYPCKLLLILCS